MANLIYKIKTLKNSKTAGLDSKSFRKKAKFMNIDVLNGIKKEKTEGEGDGEGGEGGDNTNP